VILLQKQKLVLVTPPHTASGALHKILCSPEYGGIWVNGENPDGGIDHHYGRVHDGWIHDGYKVILVIREPLARVYGLYKHYLWWLEKEGLKHDIPFDSYLNAPPNHYMHTETQLEFYTRNNLDDCDTEVVSTTNIDDVLDFDYGINILPAFDHTALLCDLDREAKTLPDTQRWKDEVNFWKYYDAI